MAPKRIAHTHTRIELVCLKAALGKYADKKNAAITALQKAGEGAVADKQAAEVRALVGDVGDRDGTTLERLGKLIGGLGSDGEATTLSSTKAEAHAYEVGLPLLSRRLRSIEGELKSFGRDDAAEWCVNLANHVGGTLVDHYSEQMGHGEGDEATTPPQLEISQ